jgi:hypothetical protein
VPQVHVTIMSAERMKPIDSDGGGFRAGITVMVRVNGYQQRTPTKELSGSINPTIEWNGGHGHTMTFKKRDEDGTHRPTMRDILLV